MFCNLVYESCCSIRVENKQVFHYGYVYLFTPDLFSTLAFELWNKSEIWCKYCFAIVVLLNNSGNKILGIWYKLLSMSLTITERNNAFSHSVHLLWFPEVCCRPVRFQESPRGCLAITQVLSSYEVLSNLVNHWCMQLNQTDRHSMYWVIYSIAVSALKAF